MKIKVALISCRSSKVRSKAGENNKLIRPPAESVSGLNNREIAPISSAPEIGVQNQTTLASPLGSEQVGVIWLTQCSGYLSIGLLHLFELVRIGWSLNLEPFEMVRIEWTMDFKFNILEMWWFVSEGCRRHKVSDRDSREVLKKYVAVGLGQCNNCPACRIYEIATRSWDVVICPIYMCLTVYEFSFILFDLCLFITIFNFILNYVLIVTFWIFT